MTDTLITPPQKSFKILLIGDYCIDEYRFGTVDRISPEAPVPIFKETRRITTEGMVGNVYQNFHKLGCWVDLYKGGNSLKTRLIDEKSKQHILRLDNDDYASELKYEHILREEIVHADAIVISDYNKGYVSYKLVKKLRDEYDGPIFIDTKKTDLLRFQGCFVKINELEFNAAQTFCKDIIVTRGSYYVQYKNHLFDVPNVDVFDVCGAGDTFLAALTYGYLSYGSIEKAIPFAIKAASITVQNLGVYAPTLKEINET